MAPTAQLATLPGPLLPLTPELERELALIFEQTPEDELPAAIVAFAFERRLLVRSPIATELAHFVTGRDGSARMVRIVQPAPPSKPTKPRKAQEWTLASPVKRPRTS